MLQPVCLGNFFCESFQFLKIYDCIVAVFLMILTLTDNTGVKRLWSLLFGHNTGGKRTWSLIFGHTTGINRTWNLMYGHSTGVKRI